MTWQPEISSVNNTVQIGAESNSALGTAVPANKLIDCFSFQFMIETDINSFTATGRKYASIVEENSEWVSGTMSGTMDFNGLIYPLASICGATSPVAHGSSSTAKDWIFTPPLSGSVVPQTYSFEEGSSARAHKFAYGLFNQFGYKLDRKTSTVSGTIQAQPLSDGITMTASPAIIPLAPCVSKYFNVYLDTSPANLGMTQLSKAISVDYSFGNVYGTFMPLNRTNIGWTSHVDTVPACTIKLMMEADAVGMSLLSALQNSTTYYLRVEGIGALIDSANTIKNAFIHDMAVKIGKPSAFQDSNGIFAIEWECTIVEDATWNNAQVFRVTNLLASL